MANAFTFNVTHAGRLEVITLGSAATVADLKAELEVVFNVQVMHQKLAGFPPRTDEGTPLASLVHKQPHKVMVIGTPSAALAAARAAADAAAAETVDVDDDDDVEEGEAQDIMAGEIERAREKIAQRVSTYRPKMLAGFRTGKNILVLDIDYTLMDHKTTAEHPSAMARPYLHDFLEAAYDKYDIIIWSATSMRWIVTKMAALGVTTSTRFAIAAMYDVGAMIEVRHPRYGTAPVKIKPLPVVWAQHPAHARPHNTIMFDDLRRNFLANPVHGLRIHACRDMPRIRGTDRELAHLAVYLQIIAQEYPDGFARLDHRSWRTFLATRGHPAAAEDALRRATDGTSGTSGVSPR